MSNGLPPVSQAEAMMRRVSPEGRARALKEQQRRQRATARLLMRCGLAGIAIFAVLAATNAWILPLSGIEWGAGVLAALLACITIAYTSREPAVSAERLSEAKLTALPAQTAEWLDQQCLALPAPARPLIDDIGARLNMMAPQIAKLDPAEPAADAVRRLLSGELPGLIDQYHAVPASRRATPGPDGRNADAHLLDGLRIVDAEVARMTEQLSRGAFDELATQSRFLELKYQGEDGGIGS